MKKLIIIALVAVSAIAAAATIKEVNTKEEVTQLPTESVETPRTAVVSNWD